MSDGSRPHTPFEEDEDDEVFTYPADADYSTRMGDILGQSDEENGKDSDGSEEGFVYNGEDASFSGGYREQLSQVLGAEEAEELEEERHEEEHLLRALSSSPIPSVSPPVSVSPLASKFEYTLISDAYIRMASRQRRLE